MDNTTNADPAHVLNLAVSSQLQQQRNFRLHQLRYLAPNPNRKPSEDELFEMASMLLEPPSRDDEEEQFNASNNNMMMMKMTTMMNQENIIACNRDSYCSIPSGEGLRPSCFLSGGVVCPPPPQLAINNRDGNMPLAMPIQQHRPVSLINVVPDDLFDDEELDSVLGGAGQQLHESQLKMQQTERRGPAAVENSFVPMVPLPPKTNFMGCTVTPETSERQVQPFSRPPITIPKTAHKVGVSITLAEKKLEDVINDNNILSYKRGESFIGNLNERLDESNVDEWCLIDFGDDSDPAGLCSNPGSRKRQSFEDLDVAAEESSVLHTGTKKSRPI